MNRPSLTNNTGKKKLAKINFTDNAIQEVIEDDEENKNEQNASI